MQFVEQDPKVLTTLRQNIAALGAADRALLHRGAALAHVNAAMPDGAAAPFVLDLEELFRPL